MWEQPQAQDLLGGETFIGQARQSSCFQWKEFGRFFLAKMLGSLFS